MTEGGPRALAGRLLYRPFDELLRLAGASGLPDCLHLDDMLAATAPGLLSGAGAPIRFVRPRSETSAGYERLIFETGQVPTRADDWHDFFNALVWMAYPRSKLAMNLRHLREIRRREASAEAGRGPVRDALTQFDECGVVVSTCVAELAEGLAAHEWESVFWARRAQVVEAVDFSLIGHASLDLLRTPFVGLCGKAVYRQVDPQWFGLGPRQRRDDVDAWLAAWIADEAACRSPRAFRPLPLLGIPGMVPENASRDYYLDPRQFRPRRAV